MGGKGPGGFQGQTGTLDPAARQRVDDSQKAVFGMITQLRDSIPGGPATSVPASPAPTAAAPGPVSGGATETAEPAAPGGGMVTPDTPASTGDMLATAVATPDSGPAPGTKPKSKATVTQT
jgi:hypothetical protein